MRAGRFLHSLLCLSLVTLASSVARSEDVSTPRSRPALAYGVGLRGAGVFSDSGGGSFKLISPEIGAQFVLDAAISGPLYLRVEPTFSTFQRKSERTVVVSTSSTLVDDKGTSATADDVYATTVVKETIKNQARLYELAPRVLLGYDLTSALSIRLGFVLGAAIGSTSVAVNQQNSELCRPLPGQTSLVYGAALHPISYRVSSGNKAFELGVVLEWTKRSISGCDRPLPDGQLEVKAGQRAEVVARGVTRDLSALTAGLQATFLTW